MIAALALRFGLTPWIARGIVLSALLCAAVAYHHYVDQGGFDRATSERAARDAVAILTRMHDNTVLAAQQATTNFNITKVKNEELAPVAAHIAADRVRVGPAICGSAAPAQTSDASRGDGTNTATRLVSDQLEADIRALELRVEEALATGRACQAFGRANGFWPAEQ